MNIIFLDIDGVLVNRRSLKERSGMKAVGDPVCVGNLNRLIALADARLVISSSWRFCGLEEMKLILSYWGVNGTVIGLTPDLSYKSPESNIWICPLRGEEIQKWLDENTGVWNDFVILDDDADMSHLEGKLVRTDFEIGLTDNDVKAALKILFDI